MISSRKYEEAKARNTQYQELSWLEKWSRNSKQVRLKLERRRNFVGVEVERRTATAKERTG